VLRDYRPFFRYLWQVRRPFIGAVLAGLLYAVASGVGLPLMVKTVFPVLFGEEGEWEEKSPWFRNLMEYLTGSVSRDTLLVATCLAIPGLFLIRGLGGIINGYLMNVAGLRAVELLRRDLFEKFLTMPLRSYQRHQSGDLLARIINDGDLLRNMVIWTANDIIKQPITLISAIGFVVWLSASSQSFFVATIGLISVPLCVYPIYLASKKLRKRAGQLQEGTGDLSAVVTETLQSPVEIRAYNLQRKQSSAFDSKLGELIRLTLKIVKYRAMVSPSIEVVAAVGFSLSLYLGVKYGVNFEDFVALGMALFVAYEPLKKLGHAHTQLKQGEAAVERIWEVLNDGEEVPEPAEPRRPEVVRGELAFEGVSYSYGEGLALHDASVTLHPGEVVALVGPSGAGKTTFANLIPRFFDPAAGRVLFDGVDLREWSKHALREEIAVVPQAPVLFHGTVAGNIRIGKPEASDAEVQAAAEAAQAHEFIDQMPRGYETAVSERGSSLSGGQRQRIALARAFLKGAPVLILDEAASSLDSESEARVMEAIETVKRGRTTVVVAHRLTSIVSADRILVFDGGRIVAEGRHENLLQSSELYRRLFERFQATPG